MAEVRESFPTLENGAGAGVPLRSIQEGETIAAKNGLIAFAFKDSTGNSAAAPVKVSGSAPGDFVPSLVAKNTAGNLVEINMRLSGDDASTDAAVVVFGAQDSAGAWRAIPLQNPGDPINNGQPVMTAADSAGTIQFAQQRLEGEAISGVAALAGLIAKGPTGNFAYLQVNASGQVLASTDSAGTNLKARNTNAGNASLTAITTLTLVASKIYEGIDVVASCFRDTYFKLSWNDNGTDNILAEGRVGSGTYNWSQTFDRIGFTSGTGTQQLIVYGQNQNSTSQMSAAIAVTQIN